MREQVVVTVEGNDVEACNAAIVDAADFNNAEKSNFWSNENNGPAVVSIVNYSKLKESELEERYEDECYYSTRLKLIQTIIQEKGVKKIKEIQDQKKPHQKEWKERNKESQEKNSNALRKCPKTRPHFQAITHDLFQ